MSENYKDINFVNFYEHPYANLSRENLIYLLEETRKSKDKAEKENLRLERILTEAESTLMMKDKEIESLNKFLKEKESRIDFIEKNFEDYKKSTTDFRKFAEKVEDKKEDKKNNFSKVLDALFENSPQNNKIVVVSVKNGKEEPQKSSPVKQLNKKRNKQKDPNRIKKPLTPFFLFSRDYKQKLKKDGSKTNLVENSKLCGIKWKNMTEEEKAPYLKIFKLNQEKYIREKKNSSSNFNLNPGNLSQNNYNSDIDIKSSDNIRNSSDSNLDSNNHKNIISKNNNF